MYICGTLLHHVDSHTISRSRRMDHFNMTSVMVVKGNNEGWMFVRVVKVLL